MNREYNLRKALFAAVEALSLTPQLTLDMPDVTPEAPTDEFNRYLEVRHFPNLASGYDWNDENTEYSGILQIALVDPSQRGELQATVITGQICDAFPKGSEFRYGNAVVKIEAPPTCLSMVQDGHKAYYPVSIRYRCGT